MIDSSDQVERVRIVEYGCADGSTVVLFDGTPAEAEALYRRHGQGRLREVVEASDARPGGSCAGCKLASVCTSLSRAPGLLGIVDADRARRTWSITNGRDYRVCPAKEHLRRLRLPRDGEYGPDALRGQAVHALLDELHEREPKRACTPADGPADPTDWGVGGWHVSGEQAELGVAQFLAHVSVCPLPRPSEDRGIAEVRSESTITVHDTTADVIVVATPDLVYAQDGSWVWRETKTSRRDAVAATDHLMETYPQVALGVVLLAEGALGGDPTFSRVELEILRAGGADIHLFDPGDSGEVARARDVVRQLASAWHGDDEHAPRPGPHCSTCEVSRWCPASAA
jgi:hypothetical protein